MTDSLRTRIAAVLHSHLLATSGEWITCSCDEHFSKFTPETFEWHVADAVIRELGLTRRTGQGPYSNQVWYQTDWSIE